MATKTCKDCGWLYITDFVIGVCERPRSDKGIVRPDDACRHWKSRAERKRKE